jgi:hypothetical protein
MQLQFQRTKETKNTQNQKAKVLQQSMTWRRSSSQRTKRLRCCNKRRLEKETHSKKTRILNAATKGGLKRKFIPPKKKLGHTLLEILSFATCLMQLKNLTCNYFGVACNMCSCMRHFLVTKDNFSTSDTKNKTNFKFSLQWSTKAMLTLHFFTLICYDYEMTLWTTIVHYQQSTFHNSMLEQQSIQTNNHGWDKLNYFIC